MLLRLLNLPSETIKDILTPFRRTHSLPNQFAFIKRANTNLDTLPSDSFHKDLNYDTFVGPHTNETFLEANQTGLPRSVKSQSFIPSNRPANPTAIKGQTNLRTKHKFVMTSTKDGGYFFQQRSDSSLKTKSKGIQDRVADPCSLTAPKHLKVSLSLSVSKSVLRKMTTHQNKSNSTHRNK